jgi:hypothetical protein
VSALSAPSQESEHNGERKTGEHPLFRNNPMQDAGDREYITDTLTKHVRKIARILGSTEELVLISVNKYKARLASLRQILDEEFS